MHASICHVPRVWDQGDPKGKKWRTGDDDEPWEIRDGEEELIIGEGFKIQQNREKKQPHNQQYPKPKTQ